MTGRQQRVNRAVLHLEQFWANYSLVDGYLDKTDAEIIDAAHDALAAALYPNEFGCASTDGTLCFKQLLKTHLETREQAGLMDENDRLREEIEMLNRQLEQVGGKTVTA